MHHWTSQGYNGRPHGIVLDETFITSKCPFESLPKCGVPASTKFDKELNVLFTDFLKPPVLFETNLALRKYSLNRPQKLNALDESMINTLRAQVEVRHSKAPLALTVEFSS